MPNVLHFGILNSEDMSKHTNSVQTTACRRGDFFAFHLVLGKKIGLLPPPPPTLEMLPPSLDTGDALKIRGKNFNKVCPTTVQNAQKWPLQSVNSQKFSGGACPRTL